MMIVEGLVVERVRGAFVGPVSFEVRPGECLAVMGPSGAGKTRLLRLLADLDPGEGQVTLDGRTRESFEPDAWRRRVMFVPAVSAWWAATVSEHFTDATRTEAEHLCASMLLPAGIMERAVAALSTGERQRLALIRALVAQPAVCLLDEPTSGLDARTASAVEACLQGALTQGAAMVVVTHDEGQARRLAQRVYRIEAMGAPHA